MGRRTKPRLFSFPREVELSYFSDWDCLPEDRVLLEEVVDAFSDVCETRTVTQDCLGVLKRALVHSDSQLRGVAVTRLAVLCHYFPVARQLMEWAARSSDVTLRVFIASGLANTPPSLIQQLLTELLEDPSWRVRKAAASVGTAVRLDGLDRILARKAVMERDARVRVVLQLGLEFQRSGP